jgi:hypothetical protein
MRSGYSHGYLLCLSFDIIINMIPELLILKGSRKKGIKRAIHYTVVFCQIRSA